MARQQTILILGGSGFVGAHLAHRLTERGWQVRIPVRRRARARHLLVNPRIEVIETGQGLTKQLASLLEGCAAAVNLVGILNEHHAGDFQRVHVELADHFLQSCQATGVPRLLHMSALNANALEPHSRYLRSKGEAEDLMHAESGPGLQVTSVRPSVIFGPDDSFFNRFAGLLKLTPGIFPLACAEARFAPVYVGDVVEAFLRCLEDDSTAGLRLDLCGPRVYTLHELVKYTARQLGLRRIILDLPDFLARLQARVLQFVPGKPFTMDNYWSLQIDSVCQEDGCARLGIQPRSVEAIVPGYLGGKRPRDRYTEYRRLARRP
ncbi:MAG: complex I NDUFA9 subunit family protein [Xanthomonadaceae bacterium]|nr:complex I NDUFA9 subunit family protein [Xanthomonadaceae bacterium]